MTEIINKEKPSCHDDVRWCIAGIFIPASGLCQIIYDRRLTRLTAFAGIVFDYCPMCGRRLNDQSRT